MNETSSALRVVGRRPRLKRRDRILVAFLGTLLVFSTVLAVRNGNWPNLVLYGVLIIGNLVIRSTRIQGPTVVDVSGIRRPWRRPSRLEWADVEGVLAPQPGIAPVRLQLTNGKTVQLLDVPAAESAAVAALGDKPITRPAPIRLVAPSPARRTDRDIELDVERRAQALTERGRMLDAEYQRLRRRH